MLAIQNFSQPDTRRGLRKLLGIIKFYHCYILKCTQLLPPLNVLLLYKSEKQIHWTDVMTKAFADIKQTLGQATLLFHHKPDASTCIMTGASNVAIGAILQLFIDDRWCSVSFFSTKLRPAETYFSIFDCVLLVTYLLIKHIRHILKGHNFYIITDHKPLTFAISSQASHHMH